MDSEKLKFYSVDVKYCDYLRGFDSKVPFIEYPRHNKFFVGVVFSIGDQKYFAPISSYNKKDKGVFNIKDNDEIISSIRMNFMFPIIEGVYEQLDINKNFSGKYKILVQKEYRYCNSHRDEIRTIARNTYDFRIKTLKDKKHKEFFDKIMIDFLLLEEKAKLYRK